VPLPLVKGRLRSLTRTALGARAKPREAGVCDSAHIRTLKGLSVRGVTLTEAALT